jgi:chemotaxis protein MotB
MGRKKKKDDGPSGPPGAPEWVVTFTDMISLLVTFFVLLMTFSSLEEYELLKVASFLSGERGVHDTKGFVAAEVQDDLLSSTDLVRGALSPHSRPAEELAENLEEMGQKKTEDHLEMDLGQVADGLVIEFGEEAAFAPGSAQVSEKLAASLGEIGRVLEHYPYLIVVEGFTDGAFRSTPSFPTADDLAFARAAGAAGILLRDSKLPASLVQISSHGDRNPRANEATAIDRQKNRRVQIRVLSLSRSRANHLEALERQKREEEG